MTFGEVDAEHAPSRRCLCRVRGLCFGLTAAGILVCNDHALTILEGKAKGPRSGDGDAIVVAGLSTRAGRQGGKVCQVLAVARVKVEAKAGS